MKTLLSCIFVILIISGCSNKAPNIKQYYRLSADYPSLTNREESKRPSVVISRPKTLSILGGRPMVATKDDGALVQLSNHYWLESPTILLHATLKEWAQHHWQHVQTSAAFDERHDRLHSKILAFEKDGDQAKVSIQFILHNSDGQVLLDQIFKQALNIQGAGYAHFVEAINQAISLILDELSHSLNTLS